MGKKYAIGRVEEHGQEIERTDTVVEYQTNFTGFPVRAPALGIDPGDRNMGIAFISPERAIRVAQIRFADAEDAVERLMASVGVVRGLLQRWGLVPARGIIATVECAAYSKLYGQVALAENRSGAIQALLMDEIEKVNVPSPGTIRKVVFGSAKIRAEDQWPELGHDGSSALACALHALLTRNGE